MSAQAQQTTPTREPPMPVNAPRDKSKPGLMGRILEWFWGGAAMRELQASGRTPSPRVIELRRRAGLAAELGRMAMEPPRPLIYGPAHDVACGLFRQSIVWALMARQEAAHPPSSSAPSAGAKASADSSQSPKAAELASLWAAADRQVLLRAAGGSEAVVDEMRQAFEGRGLQDFADLPSKQVRGLAGKSAVFAESLVDQLDDRQAGIQRVWMRRAFGLGLVVSVLVLGVIGVMKTLEATEHRLNLAQGKPWTASSHYPEFGCTSPAQDCPDSPDYFFHTKDEDDPWFILDLQTIQPISAVRVINRADCCRDRVAPLVVEVSRDQKEWKEVARNPSEFRSWKASFASAEARYVKLHVPRRSILHLREVRVFR